MATADRLSLRFPRAAWACIALAILMACQSTDDAPVAVTHEIELPAAAVRIPVAAKPPNIVLILADDLGIGDVGAYGGQVIATPQIDALASGGVRARAGYVTHPVCSPSRAGLLTGRHQQRFGWEFNPAGRDVNSGMSREQVTLADVLREQGYVTGLVGKWHLGYQQGYHPLDRGFDEFFGVLAGGTIFIDPQTAGVESLGMRRSQRDAQYGVYQGRTQVTVDEYLTDRFTHEALGFIERYREQPFFLFLSHTTPHTPLQATQHYLDPYQHISDSRARIYAAMVHSLDHSVGQVVEKLRAIGALDNTLVVFASDNGCAGYIGGACSNQPHAGFKRYHHEGGIRVPLLLHWPAGLPADSIFEHPISTLDLLPTFVAAAQSMPRPLRRGGQTTALATRGQTKDLDGVNLLPYLQGRELGRPHDYLFWRSGPTQVVRDDRWKLIRYPRTDFTAADLRSDGRLQPPPGGWPMQAQHGHLTLLYDLLLDPGETNNLAQRHPNVVTRLRGAYDRWASDLPTTVEQGAERSTLADIDGETVQLIF